MNRYLGALLKEKDYSNKTGSNCAKYSDFKQEPAMCKSQNSWRDEQGEECSWFCLQPRLRSHTSGDSAPTAGSLRVTLQQFLGGAGNE